MLEEMTTQVHIGPIERGLCELYGQTEDSHITSEMESLGKIESYKEKNAI